MKTGKNKKKVKNNVRRESYGSLSVYGKKIVRRSHSEICVTEQWHTVYISALELEIGRDEVVQNMRSLKRVLGDI